MEKSNQVRVKNEPILDSHTIQETRAAKIQSNKVKIEPIDNEMQTSKSQIEVKTEEKFSIREEFANKSSIAFLNEETPLANNQATTSNSQTNKPDSNASIDKQRYKCDFCYKRFAQLNKLVNHRRFHTREKRFECDICKKRFNTSTNLTIHRRIHTGEKPFECDFCQKRFTQQIHLQNHRRTHTGEKPYECDFCKKSFIQSTNLLDHSRIHSGEKPYECDLCKKRFYSSSALIHHRKSHNR